MDTYTEKYELAKQLYLEGNSLTKITKQVGIERKYERFASLYGKL